MTTTVPGGTFRSNLARLLGLSWPTVDTPWAGVTIDMFVRDNVFGQFSDLEARLYLWGRFGAFPGFANLPAPPYNGVTDHTALLAWDAVETDEASCTPVEQHVSAGGSQTFLTGVTARTVPADAPDDTGYAVCNIFGPFSWVSTTDGTPLGYPTTVPSHVIFVTLYDGATFTGPVRHKFALDQVIGQTESSGQFRYTAYYR